MREGRSIIRTAFFALVLAFAPNPLRPASNEKDLLVGQWAASLMIVDLPQPYIDPFIRHWVKDLGLSIIWLWAPNVTTQTKFRRLLSDLRNLSPSAPPFFAIDEEGGRVDRFKRIYTHLPPTRSLAGRTNTDMSLPRRASQELHSLGIQINFAPVADLDYPHSFLGDRTISSDPKEVARKIASWIQTSQDAGIRSVVKHFPGYWPSCSDTHQGLSKNPITLKQWEQASALPFRKAFESHVEGVMVSHCAYPELSRALGADPKQAELPASLSPFIIRRLLREKLKYPGVVIADAINMKGITAFEEIGKAAVDSFNAGADLIMVRSQMAEKVHKALVQAILKGEISLERLTESFERVERFKRSPGKTAF